MVFHNYAEVDDIDDNLAAELSLAGIEVVVLPFSSKGEVKSKVMGSVHQWVFKRAWYYWVAKGPGIPCSIATELWEQNKTVRVDGHCASPSPIEWFKGFAVGHYHVDTPEGLKDLADTIKSVYREE